MDQQRIKEQFKQVIQHSQGIHGINVDYLFSQWRNAKSWFLEQNNGEPIYEYPEKVSFELSEDEKYKKIDKFIGKLQSHYNCEELSYFIESMKNGFFNNLTDHDYCIGDTVIKKGTKIVRAFKYFIKNKALRTDLQNQASRIIQEDKITGTLCISVHPLDFLSSSENDHNWRSCHALDGEYRAGNLSYMVDDGTVMIYLKSEHNATLPNFPASVPWNSKKWRVLLFFSNDREMLFLGRQYPFQADGAADFISKKLLPAFGIHDGWTNWSITTIDNVTIDNEIRYLNQEYLPVGGLLRAKRDLIKDGKNALNYNDLLHSSCYIPMYSYRKVKVKNGFYWLGEEETEICHYGTPNTQFVLGGETYCLKCNEHPITKSGTVMCSHCEELYGHTNDDDYGYCACCGRHFDLSFGVWLENGDCVCDRCAPNRVGTCDICGALVYTDSLMYDKDLDQYVCYWCKNSE